MAAGLVDPADDERRLGTIFDFWTRADRRVPLRRRHAPGAPTRVASRRRTARSSTRSRPRARRSGPTRTRASISRAQRVAHVVPVPALVRHALGLPGHRPVPVAGRPDPVAAGVQPARRLALPVECRGVGRDAEPRGARRVRLARHRTARHRLRHVGDRARGLLAARRRVRVLRRGRRRSRCRSTRPVGPRWRARRRRRRSSCTARSRAWNAGRRSTRARTCTSRSCGRSPIWPGSRSTGRCRATAPTCTRSSSSSTARSSNRARPSSSRRRTTCRLPELPA